MERKNIQEEIEKTLNSLDGLQKAQIHGFLYEKIRHRMEQNVSAETKMTFSWKLAAAFVFIISINIFTCWKYSRPAHGGKNTYAASKATDSYYSYNTSYTY